MAKRFTDTEMWDKEWFMNLSPELKCLVKFIRDKCDVAGFWEPNWTLANIYIKTPKTITESDVLSIDGGNQFRKLPNGQIFCIGFVAFQYGELSEKCAPHKKIISLLNKHSLISERVLLGYSNPTGRVQEKEEEKDKEMEAEKDRGVQGGETLINSFNRFFEAYDKNVGRSGAMMEWCKLNPQVHAKILKHVPQYVVATPDKAYRKNPETYLIEEVWKDEIIVKTNRVNGKEKSTLEGVVKHIADNNG